jgi:hypothetical protein
LVPGGLDPHPNHTPDVTDKRWRDWVASGKPEDKFDHTVMGLDMMTFPTKHFGWQGITETMKQVSYYQLHTKQLILKQTVSDHNNKKVIILSI